MMIGWACIYGVANSIIKKADLNPYATGIIHLAVSWLVILPVFFLTGSQKDFAAKPQGVLLIVLVGVITAVAYLLGVGALRLLPVVQVSLFSMLLPVFSGISAAVLLGEPIRIQMIIGFAIMVGGMVIAFR